MTYEEQQRSRLMAQLSKKRALKEKYLRPRQQQEHPLTARLMTNASFLAIKDRVDLFGALNRLCLEAPQAGQASFDDVLACVQALADVLECGVHELFLENTDKHRRIMERLLRDLEPCDAWEDIRTDNGGCGSFTLPGFDCIYRMSPRPRAALRLEKASSPDGSLRYSLTLHRECSDLDLFPRRVLLWQECQGPLQRFTDGVLSELTGSWTEQKARFAPICQAILSHGETLDDLARLLQEVPEGLDVLSLLHKEAEALHALRSTVQAAADGLPDKLKKGVRGNRVKDALLLLSGAINRLERICSHPSEISAKELGEIAYMVNCSGTPIF